MKKFLLSLAVLTATSTSALLAQTDEDTPVRCTIVEEYTGTQCGNCVRAIVGMDKMKERFPDTFIGICVHQYMGLMSSDPMYVPEYARVFSGMAPMCIIDRKSGEIDPYSGKGTLWVDDICDDFASWNSIDPEVGINLEANWTEDHSAVQMSADVKFLTSGGHFTIAYVLTADSLCGSEAIWRQVNSLSYMYNRATTEEDLPEDLQWLYFKPNSMGEMYYNDVMIASSYDQFGINLASDLLKPREIPVTGYKTSNAYTMAMPTKETLAKAIRRDKVYAIAIVLNEEEQVANAVKVRVTEPTGIATTTLKQPAVEARYAINGTRLTAPAKGINIVRTADGQVRKVFVK